jgi:hypothetical protein
VVVFSQTKSVWVFILGNTWGNKILMLILVAAVPLALILRTIKLGTGAPAAH